MKSKCTRIIIIIKDLLPSIIAIAALLFAYLQTKQANDLKKFEITELDKKRNYSELLIKIESVQNNIIGICLVYGFMGEPDSFTDKYLNKLLKNYETKNFLKDKLKNDSLLIDSLLIIEKKNRIDELTIMKSDLDSIRIKSINLYSYLDSRNRDSLKSIINTYYLDVKDFIDIMLYQYHWEISLMVNPRSDLPDGFMVFDGRSFAGVVDETFETYNKFINFFDNELDKIMFDK